MMYGKIIIQRCPRRWKAPTAAQLEARRQFAEKYAGNKGKVRASLRETVEQQQSDNGVVTEILVGDKYLR